MRLLCAAALAIASFAASSAQPVDEAKVVALARTALDHLVSGEHAPLIAMFDDKLRAAMPPEKLRATWNAVQAQFGAFKQAADPRIVIQGDIRVAVFAVEFERAKLLIQFAFNPAGQIGGFGARPPGPAAAFSDAPYVTPENFTERDVTVDAGGWPLPGTVAMPVGNAPFPAVVLVHGSGPGDRDESIGPNKPLRDLALGLASRGIATLRYDKRTRVHGQKVAADERLTAKEEVVDDAVAAVRLLQRTPGIDPKRIFVLGHSLGAMLAPRIGAAAPEVAGLILLAGAVRSLPQLLIDQTRYLALADGTISPDEARQIEEVETLKERVAALAPGDPAVTTGVISAPASYWVDLRDYDPPAAARKLSMPMLILQGERDYQVTMEDFAKWRAALGARKDVTFASYPALNHLFLAGTGKSLPAEYSTAGHVAAEVIADIAKWIAAH